MNLGVPRRGQRWLLVVLALALAGAAAFCFLRSSTAGEEATAEAVSSAEEAARGIGARLSPEDLSGTMGSSQAASVSAYVHRRFLEADQTVMVWDEEAVVVFADEGALIGTQDRQERDRIARVLTDGTRTQQTESSLHVFAPVNPRRALRFRHAQIRELRFPRTQDVRLDACDLANFRRPEQRLVRDFYPVRLGH